MEEEDGQERKEVMDLSDGGEERSVRAVIAPPIIPLHFSWTFSEE